MRSCRRWHVSAILPLHLRFGVALGDGGCNGYGHGFYDSWRLCFRDAHAHTHRQRLADACGDGERFSCCHGLDDWHTNWVSRRQCFAECGSYRIRVGAGHGHTVAHLFPCPGSVAIEHARRNGQF